jgi:hypothetical protein
MPAKESASLTVPPKLTVWFEIVDNKVFNIVIENGSVYVGNVDEMSSLPKCCQASPIVFLPS